MTRTAAVLVVLFSPSLGLASEALSDENVLSIAESEFAHGVELRGNVVEARPHFARAAAAYDELWRRGHHNPTLALNRSRAHRLAGNLPSAIVALHGGRAVARYDRSLRVELEESRSAVAYPLDGDLATECRPKPRVTISSWMSPADAYLAAGLLWLLACAAAVRFWMTRNWLWLLLAGLGLVALLVLGGFWWDDQRHREQFESRPLVIVKNDVVLRKGNGTSYPPRFVSRLPKGVEARELTRRGGWVQVELAGGAVGWLPQGAVLTLSAGG